MSRGGTRLYVGGLSSRTRERDLDYLFSKYGRVERIDLKNGFGFVEYSDHRDADDAVHYLDRTDFDGARISVEFSRGRRDRDDRGPPRNLMRSENRVKVEGLSTRTSWQDLKDHMRKAGDVIYTDVVRDGDTASGVAEYKNLDDAKYAVTKLDDTELGGQRIRVRLESGGGDRGRSPSPRRRSPSPKRRSRSRSREREPAGERKTTPGRSPTPEKKDN